jgi:hypothetical protein
MYVLRARQKNFMATSTPTRPTPRARPTSELCGARAAATLNPPSGPLTCSNALCRLRYKALGPDVKLNFSDQLTAQRRTELDAMSLEELLASYRAKGVLATKSSQYRGVSYDKKQGAWRAELRIDGRMKYLGYFADEAAAGRASDKAIVKRDGRCAHPAPLQVHMCAASVCHASSCPHPTRPCRTLISAQ